MNKEKNMPSEEITQTEQVEDFNDVHPDDAPAYDCIRAKWAFDGAETLTEAANMLRSYADHLDAMENQGYRLEGPIADDYGFIVPPPEAEA